MYPVTFNDPTLTERMVPTLERVAGAANVSISPLITGAEDFSFFQRVVPGFYIFLGSVSPGIAPETSPTNHSPLYAVDEAVLPLGMRTLANLAADYLFGK
jgi:metal-dependent amidase/aminoacylase/carboxypeptidase family protein